MKQQAAFFTVLSLGIAHALNDFWAGQLIAHSGSENNIYGLPLLLALYVTLAFGGQLPLAWLLKGKTNAYTFIYSALGLNIVSVFLCQLECITASVICSGISGAFFHVCAGAITLQNQKRNWETGMFAAPGVMGLTLGGLLPLIPAALLLLLFAATLMLVQVFRPPITFIEAPEKKPLKALINIDAHDRWMILVLIILSLRSAIWNIYQNIYHHNFSVILCIGLSAFAGKILGGVLADKTGEKRYVFISLLLSNILLPFAWVHPVFLYVGLCLLQSAIPASARLLYQHVNNVFTVSAWVFGASIALGGFTYFFLNDSLLIALLFIMLGLLLVFQSYPQKTKINEK